MVFISRRRHCHRVETSPPEPGNKRGLVGEQSLDGLSGEKLVSNNATVNDAIWQVAGTGSVAQVVDRDLMAIRLSLSRKAMRVMSIGS
ncbi:MAG TPA: hypothetical protein VFC26_07245 [Verrucomicrobiae bacterium]|nr:hypothetical protein [Verrucomicrobiae bacterium]